jgi:integrase
LEGYFVVGALNKDYQSDEWRNDKATNDWLKSLKASTAKAYRTKWIMFLKFTNMSGDQILADRQTDMALDLNNEQRYKWERTVLEFKQWMIKQPLMTNPADKQSQKSAVGACATVRGFFSHWHVPLQYSRTEKKRLISGGRKTEDYLFSIEDIKRLAEYGDEKEQYVVVAGKSFGLRISDFCALTRGNFDPYMDRPVPIGIGPLNTLKENVPAYPFIDSDAFPVIKRILDKMTREGRVASNEKMLVYARDKEAGVLLKRLAKRAGIQTGNKRIRFHCLRKFLIDRLSSHMSESKWKQIVGKQITEGAYVSPLELRECYKRAMVDTTFSKLEEKDRDKFETLKTMAKGLGITEEMMAQYFTAQNAVTLPKQIVVLEKVIESKGFADKINVSERYSKEVIKKDCPDGEHCQRLVTEQELETLLMQGWHVVFCLPSGKIVVSNE